MWTTTIEHKHEKDFDKVSKIFHDFGNGVTIVTDFENKAIKQLHGAITVHEHELIEDTEKYMNYLSNIDNEVNPK